MFIEVSFRVLGYEAVLCNDKMTDEYNTVDESILPTYTLVIPMTSVIALCLLHVNYQFLQHFFKTSCPLDLKEF